MCIVHDTAFFKDEDDQERKEAFLGYLKHLEDTNLTMTTKNIVENRSRMKKIILEILSELDSELDVSSTIPSSLPIIRGTTEHSRALRPVQVCLSKFNLDFCPVHYKFLFFILVDEVAKIPKCYVIVYLLSYISKFLSRLSSLWTSL